MKKIDPKHEAHGRAGIYGSNTICYYTTNNLPTKIQATKGSQAGTKTKDNS